MLIILFFILLHLTHSFLLRNEKGKSVHHVKTSKIAVVHKNPTVNLVLLCLTRKS